MSMHISKVNLLLVDVETVCSKHRIPMGRGGGGMRYADRETITHFQTKNWQIIFPISDTRLTKLIPVFSAAKYIAYVVVHIITFFPKSIQTCRPKWQTYTQFLKWKSDQDSSKTINTFGATYT